MGNDNNVNITLYSTGCPQCIILEKKLDQKNVKYEIITDEETMIDKGFMGAPMLDVEGKIMNYKQAVDWVNELGD